MKTIHHFQPLAYPQIMAMGELEQGSKIISAAWRQDKPALYIERRAMDTLNRCKLESFYVMTGQVFEAQDFTFVGTVTPDNRSFFHVYARITDGRSA